jgi:hypothetical protein
MNQVEGKIKPFECNKIIACRESDSTKIDNKGVFLFAPRWRWRYLKIASINWIDKLQRSHCRRRHHIVSLNIPQQCRKLWEDWGLNGACLIKMGWTIRSCTGAIIYVVTTEFIRSDIYFFFWQIHKTMDHVYYCKSYGSGNEIILRNFFLQPL